MNLPDFIRQHTEAQRELLVPLPFLEFESALSQQTFLTKTRDMEGVAIKFDDEAYGQKYYGWIATPQFLLRPVFKAKYGAMNYFVMEGSYAPFGRETKVSYTLKPNSRKRLVLVWFLSIMICVSGLLTVFLLKGSLLGIGNFLGTLVVALGYYILIYKPHLDKVAQQFEQDVKNLITA